MLPTINTASCSFSGAAATFLCSCCTLSSWDAFSRWSSCCASCQPWSWVYSRCWNLPVLLDFQCINRIFLFVKQHKITTSAILSCVRCSFYSNWFVVCFESNPLDTIVFLDWESWDGFDFHRFRGNSVITITTLWVSNFWAEAVILTSIPPKATTKLFKFIE